MRTKSLGIKNEPEISCITYPDTENQRITLVSSKVTKEKKVVDKNESSEDRKARRINHNECERNRRTELRKQIANLMKLIPLGEDESKKTTLILLHRTKHIIQNLEYREKKYVHTKEALKREQRLLKRKLQILQKDSKNEDMETNASSTYTLTISDHLEGSSPTRVKEEEQCFDTLELELSAEVTAETNLCLILNENGQLEGVNVCDRGETLCIPSQEPNVIYQVYHV